MVGGYFVPQKTLSILSGFVGKGINRAVEERAPAPHSQLSTCASLHNRAESRAEPPQQALPPPPFPPPGHSPPAAHLSRLPPAPQPVQGARRLRADGGKTGVLRAQPALASPLGVPSGERCRGSPRSGGVEKGRRGRGVGSCGGFIRCVPDPHRSPAPSNQLRREDAPGRLCPARGSEGPQHPPLAAASSFPWAKCRHMVTFTSVRDARGAAGSSQLHATPKKLMCPPPTLLCHPFSDLRGNSEFPCSRLSLGTDPGAPVQHRIPEPRGARFVSESVFESQDTARKPSIAEIFPSGWPNCLLRTGLGAGGMLGSSCSSRKVVVVPSFSVYSPHCKCHQNATLVLCG